MIIPILCLVLFVLLVCLLLYFIFCVLLPVMQFQNMLLQRQPLFGDGEIDNSPGDDDECRIGTKKAVVLCSSERTFPGRRIHYEGVKSCRLFDRVYSSEFDCDDGCVGFGDCVSVCPLDAIIIRNGVAVVTASCTGCGDCIDVCPKHLIAMIPASMKSCESCRVSPDSQTKCSACNKPIIIDPPVKKVFKFWQSCYKIFFRR